MKNIPIILLLLLEFVFTSCAKKECDCELLFPDKDSTISIAMSPNEEINKLIARINKNEWKMKQLKSEMMVLLADSTERGTTQTFRKEFEVMQQRIRVAYKDLLASSVKFEEIKRTSNNKDILKSEPYTGNCTYKIIQGEAVYLTAQFENGKIIGKWKYLDKGKNVLKEVSVPAPGEIFF